MNYWKVVQFRGDPLALIIISITNKYLCGPLSMRTMCLYIYLAFVWISVAVSCECVIMVLSKQVALIQLEYHLIS